MRSAAYGDFFALFGDFQSFVDFFLFQDLVTSDYQQVDFYLPFDGFARSGVPRSVGDYIRYREATLTFIAARGRRMQECVTR